ncbi:Transcription-repair coupling factor [Plesiocystis pacifica SIR-1]|uniref:Transcription-repair-coupling factor n=1 Tax=Plesiocystis pacifica SIR-1 TaxID=391625 RepID=A6GBX4_9BACT|nr:transcription-repair coupling factor [Plesiocystis pacifica]EDM76647.1 Transcription-repair coupling factor [Plesiocystis pacifica SIR-1]
MALSALEALPVVLTALRSGRRKRVLGAEGGYRGLLLARAMADPETDAPLVYVAPDDTTAQTVAADVAFFAGSGEGASATDAGPVGSNQRVLTVPEIDVSPYGDVSPDPRSVGARMAALERLRAGEPELIILSLRSLMRKTIPAEAFAQLCRTWAREGELGREEAAAFLSAAGYRRVDVVGDPGCFAIRGGIMDVWVPLERFPARLEWWGDEIERIRVFDPDSQRSLREVRSIRVHPVRETVATGSRTTANALRLAVLELGDRIEVPSSATRQVIANLGAGVDFFGIDALTPVFHDGLASVADYLPANARWYLDEPEALVGLGERMADELDFEYRRAVEAKHLVAAPEDFFCTREQLREQLRGAAVVGARLDLYDPEQTKGDRRGVIRVDLGRNAPLRAKLEAARGQKGGELLRPVVDHIRELGVHADATLGGALDPSERDPWDVVLVAPNTTHAERLTAMLRGYGLRPEGTSKQEREHSSGAGGAIELGGLELQAPRLRVIAGTLSEGFASEGDRLLVVSESEIFGPVARREGRRRRRRKAGVASLSQLSIGDYVVHVVHGVGRYVGLTKLAAQGVPGDFVIVEYAKKDKLYLPVHRIGEIERYVSAEAKAPKLDRMGGQTFQAKAKKIRSDVRQLAEELLQIYAQREAMTGHAFAPGGDMYAEFEQTFPFEETPDQADAIDSVQDDLSSQRPMDRLVCGDVGFGKTEVALRAAFRVAAAGKQVAVLAPTTVLVQQHYLTFSERMSAFPLEVGVLNRFSSPADRKRTLAGIKDGTVDVVVGTHRLLSRDVRFKELGLVIIDEEQRFGVKQKDRFKKLKTSVDMLTLTATPIPRTLHMSLLGMREISMITTAPVDRLAVRTYLTRHSDVVLEEGIRRELARGGQIFYVVPRVMGIEEHAVRIRELVPEARVIVAHGQMPPEMLEQTMVDFVRHEADVLVSTTIIESGLDIPRANTMFIARADQFGLAQLYQLRGRIGRSKLRAYCYLMVASLERLSEDARRRLEAIQRHSELGAGFNVASQDLEIRGAGDLLGRRQSGSIQAIGFEAYARILGEAVAELRGDPISQETDPEVAFDVPAFLPDTYVEDVGARLDFYRRLSTSRDADEVREVLEELHDRYGELPVEARHFGLMMACKSYGRRLRATALELRAMRFSIRLSPETPLSPEVALGLSDATDGRVRLAPGGERILATIPNRQGKDCSRQLEVCEGVLAELATYARLDQAAQGGAGGRRRGKTALPRNRRR